MVKFMYDPIIYPMESSWFGEINERGNIVSMEDSIVYKEDLIGLKKLHDDNKIKRELIDGVHLMFNNDHIMDIFVEKGLK